MIERVDCPICSAANGRHVCVAKTIQPHLREISNGGPLTNIVPDDGTVLKNIRGDHMWRTCPICLGRGRIKKALFEALMLAIAGKETLPNYTTLVTLRKAVNGWSRKKA